MTDMKELNAKLIVSDFDGTLIDSHQQVHPKVIESVKQYIADGGRFAIATGRMIISIIPEAKKLGLTGLVAGYQGSMVADIESGKILKENNFTCAQTQEICSALESLGAYVNAYYYDELYTNIPPDNRQLMLYEQITGIMTKHVNMPMSEFVAKNNMCCQKITSLCKPQDKLALYEKLKAVLGDKYDVTYSADVLVEVSPITDNKGEALKFIANYYGIPMEQTVAVGDNLNDLSMILAAGVGVAVSNAAQPLKSMADYVTKLTNDDGAIAEVIEKFGYKN